MDKIDTYLLLTIGVLVISVLFIELVPMPQISTVYGEPSTPVAFEKRPRMNSGAQVTLTVLGNTALTTVEVP